MLRAAVSQSTEPWFPEASRAIAAVVWAKIACDGFTLANYGTHRWLMKNPTVDRNHSARLELGSSLECLIESLPGLSRARYEEGGLKFPAGVATKDDLTVIQAALALIAAVPTMHATVRQYLRSLHILEPDGFDYDVSHSDPGVPFSIFVSVPHSDGRGPVRLAESIVHECMHLQLTIAEQVLPLVEAPDAYFFSPWQQTLRPVTGVLQGFYVFVVVREFLRVLSLTGCLTLEERAFVCKRRREITREIAQVTLLGLAEELTNDGRFLVRHLNRCVGLQADRVAR